MKLKCCREMFLSKNGFTLIELLVVVLIVGILAAVALPQYQKAVRKSRAIQGLTLLKKITDAQEVYYLEHSQYTNDIAELNIDISSNIKHYSVSTPYKQQYFFKCINGYRCAANVADKDMPEFEFYMKFSTNGYRTKKLCSIHNGKSEQAKSICLSLGAVPDPSVLGGKQYFLFVNL